jgi:gliding motility-associated-like protein
MYWLEVTSAQGCSNREYIDVKEKVCKKYIYFPNAFAPAGNQNRVFRPILSGLVVKYHLYIYNRWGQKVFETSDPHMGWDGNINGKPQDGNSFVWYCQYQFAGDPEKIEKGTVILIR